MKRSAAAVHRVGKLRPLVAGQGTGTSTKAAPVPPIVVLKSGIQL